MTTSRCSLLNPEELRSTKTCFRAKKNRESSHGSAEEPPHAHEAPPPAHPARPGSFAATPPFGAPQQQSFVAPQAASFAVRPPPAMAPPPVAGYLLEYVKIESHDLKINSIKQTLRDSFSAAILG